MRSDTADVLADIAEHIELAMQFPSGLNYDAFQSNTRTLYAVTRCLEIISEASRRLPEDVMARHPQIPWRNIAGAGNVYRHDYEDVAARLVWETVQSALPPLQAVIAEEIERLP
ncbi:MAG TPA: DUF86 domain-containing protein [Terracidiphilus sp.]|nr:DUF86 domain-containing protein [Terracidiphilus sp.]